ncbi:hypothetical protein [Streptomyces sp. NPDC096068]|uniref:hypothetical protein n=1 Tax=Streptomyces sp. NPDC096068 TaxID=3155424 RepID=UPI00332C2182
MAGLELGAQVVLAGLLVGEDAPAAGGGEGVDLAVELLSAGGGPGVADEDLGPHRGLGGQEFERVGFK